MKKFIIVLTLFLSALGLSAFIQAGICTPGDKAQVKWKGSWYPAKVIKASETQCYIRYDGYGKDWDEWVGADRIKITGSTAPQSNNAAAKLWEEGDPVQVKWKGTWYPAHVLKVKGNQLKVHYDGYESSWDEWVGPDRYK